MKLYIEIRSGVGGKDAENFAEELMSVYLKFAGRNGLKSEIIDNGKTKIISIEGESRFIKILENEAGVHKVQRIPETESKGRMQTSTATVACFRDTGIKEFVINEKDLEFQYYKASGPGGQYRNKTETAVRLIHKPTGIVVTCANERSQLQNKQTAIEIMICKLQKVFIKEELSKIDKKRLDQVKKAERSESKRIYNYQRDIVYDNITNKSATLKDIMKKAKIELLA